MPSVLYKEIAWKEVNMVAALLTCLRFDPEKVFHISIWGTTVQALCSVKWTYLIFEPGYKLISGLAVGVKIKGSDLLVDDPVCHRIDVVADNIAPKSIGFEQGRSSTHERIGHLKTFEIMRLEIYFV
jgi:hypothetical protein